MGKPIYALIPFAHMDNSDTEDDLIPAEWCGHCPCYHEDNEPCCGCDAVPGDYEEDIYP